MDFEEKRQQDYLRSVEAKADASVVATRVSPLDPDFLVVLFFAICFDFVFFVLALFDATVIPILIRIFLGIIAMITVGIWDYIRTGKIERMKEEAGRVKEQTKKLLEESKQRAMQKQAAREAKKRALKEAKGQAGKKTLTKAEKKIAMKTAKKAARKVVVKTGTKVTVRGVAATIGTIIPIIAMFPFYTIWVLSSLRSS